MKNYIVYNEGINILGLADNLPNLSMVTAYLDEKQVSELAKANVRYSLAEVSIVRLFGGDYEKKRSEWKKFRLRGITGSGVKVAVIDSGCNTTYVPCDYNVNFTDDTINDNLGHGTQTTSIIKSAIGIAPGCEIYHLKAVRDSNTIEESDFLQAIDYIIENSIDCVNMSFGTYFSSMQSALDDLYNSGCIAFASAGNSVSDSNIALPAGLRNCVAVNAINEDGTAFYKNNIIGGGAVHGIDIAASGANCETITRFGTTITNYGTSFSSPFAVGMFALLKQELGISDNKRVLQAMFNKCLKQTDTSNFGKGILTA